MITNEMKAKIFGLYVGCPCTYRNDFGRFTQPVDWLTIQKIQLGSKDADTIQLKLRPLSEITDEDAISVVKIFKGNCEWQVNDRQEDEVVLKNDKGQDFAIYTDGSGFRDDYSILDPSLWDYIESIDFLRSKGYALPAFGIDLFESSLAIPKQ